MRKLQKIFAMLLSVSMVMSLLSVNAFAEELSGDAENAGESVDYFGCEMELHVHNADCYTPQLKCEKHVHDENCYDAEQALTCTISVGRDLNCDGHTEHGEGCYNAHTHGEECYTASRGDVICMVEGCEHLEDACYNMSKTLTCTESTDPVLVCEIPLHTHTDETCYVDHVHVEDCYEDVLTCELPVHEKHVELCLTDEAGVAVAAVIQKMTDAPELQDMQDARGTTYADGTADYPTADAAAAAYDTFIDGCFTEREAALKAYQDMPDELKPFVPQALVTKLTKELETVFKKPESRAITAGEDGYNFMSVYSPCYEMSGHMVSANGGVNNDIPQTLMMVEADRDYTWTMDGHYISGVSNYEVLYCCDAETGYEGGIYYKRKNLEDSPYYDATAAKHIRAIVMNSYPYVTLEEMEESLPAKFAGLTRAEAISAVQTAIWSYANNATALAYSQTFDVASNSQWGKNVHDYTNEMFDWWDVGKRKFYVARNDERTGAGDRIDALVKYLTALEPVAPKADEIIITSVEIVGEPIPVFSNGDEYEVLLKVELNSSGSGKKDSLMLTATADAGSAVTAEVEQGKTVYYLLVSAKSGDNITVELSGTQKLPRGVYFYEAKPVVDAEGNVITAARDVSQNLVGVAMGDTAVYAKDSLTFEMDAPEGEHVFAALGLKKVNETGTALAGAEFTLAYDVDSDGKADPFKSYTTDDNGEAVIEGLMAGKTYELTETKAPAGYDPITGAIEFTVEQKEDLSLDMVFNLPAGVTCDDETTEDYILTVVNCEEPDDGDDGGGNGGGGKTPDPDPVEIPDPNVPTTVIPELPDEEPEETPVVEELPEEEVPLASVPKTGDVSALWLALTALSGTGLAGVTFCKKREEEQ